jgi:hypothetical protein
MSDLLNRLSAYACQRHGTRRSDCIYCLTCGDISDAKHEIERLQAVVDAALTAVDAYFAVGNTHGSKLEKMQYLANALAPFRALDGEVKP